MALSSVFQLYPTTGTQFQDLTPTNIQTYLDILPRQIKYKLVIISLSNNLRFHMETLTNLSQYFHTPPSIVIHNDRDVFALAQWIGSTGGATLVGNHGINRENIPFSLFIAERVDLTKREPTEKIHQLFIFIH